MDHLCHREADGGGRSRLRHARLQHDARATRRLLQHLRDDLRRLQKLRRCLLSGRIALAMRAHFAVLVDSPAQMGNTGTRLG